MQVILRSITLISFVMVTMMSLGNVNGQPLSDFEDGTLQGWTKVEPFNGGLFNNSTDGNPGKFMRNTDTMAGGGTLQVEAPSAFTGNLSVYEGIAWDEYLYDCSPEIRRPTFPILVGTDGTKYRERDFQVDQLEIWVPRGVLFDPTAWELISSSGTASFEEVLQNVAALRMNMEISSNESCASEAGIDNILLFYTADPTIVPIIPTECPEVPTECPVSETLCPSTPTWCPLIPTECPVMLTECPPVVLTECPEIPTECPTVETECPITPTGCPVVPTECPTIDRDGDELFNVCDNCDDDYNPLQEDSYPPGGNDCGDACECEGNFDGDLNQDADDAAIFQIDFGRTDCTNSTPCNGDFDCDGNVDEDDQTIFLSDFGRSEYSMNPCPTCATEPWCVYTVQSDSDNDGIYDDNDNCPDTPNGPLLGTCTEGTVGETCTSNGDCDPDGVCSMNQEDWDVDGVGDVCDDVQMCKGNFDYDGDVDGTDAALFKSHFGRGGYTNPCPPDGPAPVEKTWQTTSYATGDDGELQRGVPFPEPRFVDNADGTVRDNLTGLIWLKNANCDGTKNWNNAISECNTLADGQCGLADGSQAGDWRLPNHKELFTLVDAENYDPSIPSGHPFTNVASYYYWSSTTYALDTDNAWNVFMFNGLVSHGPKTSPGPFVWPVRGGH